MYWISGEIPNSVYELANLQVLRLDNNRLTGEVSASLRDLTRLRNLNLSRNKLTGMI